MFPSTAYTYELFKHVSYDYPTEYDDHNLFMIKNPDEEAFCYVEPYS